MTIKEYIVEENFLNRKADCPMWCDSFIINDERISTQFYTKLDIIDFIEKYGDLEIKNSHVGEDYSHTKFIY
jgi:hypothetical protein